MPFAIEPRPTQTKVKHTILSKYLQAWGGIIITSNKGTIFNAQRQGRSVELRLVYVDCNAYCGRYNGDAEDHNIGRDVQPVFGSPIIGIQGLDRLATWARDQFGITVKTNAILIEKDRGAFEELKNSLALANLTQRVHYTDDFYSLRNTEIAVVHGDSTKMASKLTAFTQQSFTFSLYLMDPWGPAGTPLNFVGDIISRKRHDTIIFMHYFDLYRKSGFLSKTNVDPKNQKQIEHYDAQFGHKEWRYIGQRLIAGSDGCYSGDIEDEVPDLDVDIVIEESNDPESEMMNCYRESLQSVDSELIVKSVNLRFPGTDKTIYYLYLTTHNPAGALKMNEVLHEAVKEEDNLRWRLKMTKQRKFQPMLDLDIPSERDDLRPTTEQIAQDIRSQFRKTVATRRDVYKRFANSSYFPGEIDNAIRYLKKKSTVKFDSELRHDTSITFL